MPGAPDDDYDRSGDDGDYRVVLGEESLDWNRLTEDELWEVLDTLGDLLEPLADGRQVVFMERAYDIECLPSVTLADALYTPGSGLPRDARARLQQLLQKCRVIDPRDEDLPQPVRVHDSPWREPSWGMAHALARAAAGRAMSCLVVPTAVGTDGTTESTAPTSSPWSSGWLTFERATETGQELTALHILSAPRDATGFWRGVCTREAVPEAQFFALTGLAFPQLLFSDTLRFQHFKGSYADVLPWLVKLLGLLNDHFAGALAICAGDQKKVQARLKALGAEISPESPNTKKNAQAWQQRMVAYGDEDYRCEWHGKRLWDRDRVHFSLPIPAYDDRILIGIFTGHLST